MNSNEERPDEPYRDNPEQVDTPREVEQVPTEGPVDKIRAWLRNFPKWRRQAIYLSEDGEDVPQQSLKNRIKIISLSALFLFLFSFIIFCKIFFAPIHYSDPIFPDKTTNTTARLLTLNIFMRPPLINNYYYSDYKDDRVAYIEKYILPEYDIIAFQEAFAFASRRKDRLIEAAIKQGYNYHIQSPRKYPWSIGIDGGLLIISRFPIRQSNVIEYPRGTHSDWLCRKGALHAEIELNPYKKIHLYTTHTQASYEESNKINQGDTNIRLSQFAQLHQFIHDTAADSSDPIMVVGDLNVDAATHPPGVPVTKRLNASSPEYLKLYDVLKGDGVPGPEGPFYNHPWKISDLRDAVYDHFGYHPVTFADYEIDENGEVVPSEVVFTYPSIQLSVQSIDRIFFASRGDSIKIKTPTVQKFQVKDNKQMSDEERKRTYFTQISDHNGVDCEIHLS